MPKIYRTDSGGTTREITKLYKVDSSGTAREITKIYKIDPTGTQREFVIGGGVPFTAQAAPDYVEGLDSSYKPVIVSTSTTSVVVAGASPPVYYTWVQLSSSGGPWTIDQPNNATTSFRIRANPDTTVTGTFKCTAQNSLGQTVETNVVTASVTNGSF